MEAGANDIHLTEMPSTITIGTHAGLLVVMPEVDILQCSTKLLYLFILVDLADDLSLLFGHDRLTISGCLLESGKDGGIMG